MSRAGLSIRAADAHDVDGLLELFAGAGMAASRARLLRRLSPGTEEVGVVLLAEDWGPPSGVLHVHWWTPLLSAAPVALISTLLVPQTGAASGLRGYC